jgi:hypothetical protein
LDSQLHQMVVWVSNRWLQAKAVIRLHTPNTGTFIIVIALHSLIKLPCRAAYGYDVNSEQFKEWAATQQAQYSQYYAAQGQPGAAGGAAPPTDAPPPGDQPPPPPPPPA